MSVQCPQPLDDHFRSQGEYTGCLLVGNLSPWNHAVILRQIAKELPSNLLTANTLCKELSLFKTSDSTQLIGDQLYSGFIVFLYENNVTEHQGQL